MERLFFMTAMEVCRMLSIKDINIFKENMLDYTNLHYSDDEFLKTLYPILKQQELVNVLLCSIMYKIKTNNINFIYNLFIDKNKENVLYVENFIKTELDNNEDCNSIINKLSTHILQQYNKNLKLFLLYIKDIIEIQKL